MAPHRFSLVRGGIDGAAPGERVTEETPDRSRLHSAPDLPEELPTEAIDYCLACAHYTADPLRPEVCIHWDTCDERPGRSGR
jgi:hypothetical protein